MEDTGHFYWLKLQKDFFKQNNIRIIEAMPNGKEYVLFYMKLLCEGLSHDGILCYKESIPYNEEMLSAITNTNIDIIRSAVKLFSSMGLLELLDDGTYYLREVEEMTGKCSNNSNANRQRRFREKQKQELLAEHNATVTKRNALVTHTVTEPVTNDNESIEYRDKRLDNRYIYSAPEEHKETAPVEEEKNKKPIKPSKIIPPSVEQVREYCVSRNNGIDPEAFCDFYTARDWMSGKTKIKDWQAAVRTWEKKNGRKPAASPKKSEDQIAAERAAYQREIELAERNAPKFI